MFHQAISLFERTPALEASVWLFGCFIKMEEEFRDSPLIGTLHFGNFYFLFIELAGVIMTPTRELALQIFRECKKFCKPLNLRVVCVYGGTGISEQVSGTQPA